MTYTMNSLKIFAAFGLIILGVSGCKEEVLGPLSKEGQTPKPISNIRIEPLPGGAKFTYAVPNDDDLLYVKAVYEAPKGNIREVKASFYVDSLIIDGFGDELEHEVQLYTVSRSERQSEPVKVTIKPLTPPLTSVRRSLTMVEDFGGVTVSFTNESEANISVNILVKKAENEWVPIETFYTKLKAGIYSARGQESKLTEFGAFIRDRFNNKSDTLKLMLTPIFEKELPVPDIINTLPSDVNTFYQTYNYTRLFDKNIDVVATGLTHTAVGSGMVSSFTLDYKRPTTFSRFKFWQRGLTQNATENSHLYNNASPEIFELYGSNTLNDDFAAWTKIQTYTLVKPSGLPLGIITNEDMNVAKLGHDFQIPLGTPAFRYIRWRTTKTFARFQYVWYAEMAFFGNN